MAKQILYLVSKTIKIKEIPTSKIIGASWEHSGAERIIEKEKFKYSQLQQEYDRRTNIFWQTKQYMKKWEFENPPPERTLRKKFPKWKPVKGRPHIITEEMVKERKEIQDYNDAMLKNDIFDQAIVIWRENKQKTEAEYVLATFGLAIDNQKSDFIYQYLQEIRYLLDEPTERTYEIQEVVVNEGEN